MAIAGLLDNPVEQENPQFIPEGDDKTVISKLIVTGGAGITTIHTVTTGKTFRALALVGNQGTHTSFLYDVDGTTKIAAVRNIINVVPFLRMPMHGFKYPSGTVIKVSTDVAGTVVLIGWEE